MSSYTAPPGVFDIVPREEREPWRASHLWSYVESLLREKAALFGFEEIRTPLFEKEELFVRNVGESSDIVSKEMYLFTDRGGRKLALRPEGTAAVMRALIEHRLDRRSSFLKLFYIAPMFRYERAQAGRYRQHHQFGVEAIGLATPMQDVEVMDLLWSCLTALGLEGLQLQLNSLGNKEEREHYRTALVDYLANYRSLLSSDSQRRLETNPLRILDSKDSKDQEILAEAPNLFDSFGSESLRHFESVQQLLSELGIPYQINQKLVRGLDYYNGVVFEVTSSALGAQNSLGGGGRYDGMLREMGASDLPSIGFGCGLERMIQVLIAQKKQPNPPEGAFLYLIPLGEAALLRSFHFMHALRGASIPVQMELAGRKVNKAMQYANAISARYTLVIGDEELASQKVRVKDMETGRQEELSLDCASFVSWFSANAKNP